MKLFAWQQRAAVDAAGKSGWGLFAAPGTGKTLAALNITQQENLVPVVVAPKAVKPQWLDAGVWHAYHYEQLFNRENCQLIARQLREERCCFIVDEGHRIANPNTLTTRSIIQLGKLATKRLDLTGTPTANSPADFYAQMKFLRPDVKLESRREFQERYLVPNKGLASRIRGNPFIPLRNPDGTLRLRNMDEFLDRISRYGTFLRDEEVAELPERTVAVRECTPDAALMKAYKELHEHYVTEVGTTTLTAANAAVLATRLLRLASGLGAAEESAPLFTNPKIGQLMADLEQFVVERKVICWSVWTAERDQLRHELEKARVPFTSDAEKFKTDPSIKVLVASPKQHGAGLNLQAATYQLWLSRTWSLIEREQGLRRNYRVGQTERTHVIDYVTAGTIDKRALNILENKADLLDLIIKGKL